MDIQYLKCILKPPQKSQRGQKINKSPIQGIAETLNLKFRTPKYLKIMTRNITILKVWMLILQ